MKKNSPGSNANIWLATAASFVLLLLASTAQAQWTPSGNNIYYNSGNVGIGVADNLSTRLTVGRDLELDSYNDGSTRWGLVQGYDRTTGIRPLWIQGSKFYFATGNVGIGTASPGQTLELNRASGNNLLGFDSNGTSFALMGVSSIADNPIVGNTAGGLGIRTANKEMLFSINGGNSAQLAVATSGNVGIGTVSPDTSLNVKAAHNTWRIGDVYSTSNQYAGISDAAPDGTSYFLLSRVGVGGGDRYVNAPTGGSLDLQVGGSSALTILSNRNIGIGKSNPTVALDVVGSISLTGTINAKYQDVAEWVPSSEQIAIGTVVVLDATKSNQVISSTQGYDTRVAGVVSERPGIALGEGGEGKVLVATTGRVLVKVDASNGPIHIGDLLVTSDVPGLAMKSEPITIGNRKMHMPGTLIGKALEPMEKGSGKILVLLSLQ